jgi:endonuclease YncB( thermonuclease family)
MRIKRIIVIVIAGVFLSSSGVAAMFKWRDADGSLHVVDNSAKLPAKYQNILRYDVDHYMSPGGIGFDRDEDGNYQFFDHASPAKARTRRNAPEPFDSPPGVPVTPQQLAEVKRRYLEWGGEPRPEVMEARVSRIISADTFELDSGQKVTYVGIMFPDELKGETKIHKEAVEYQKKIMQKKTVNLIFGPQRFDDKGRMLAYVFVGKDMFVNADLVMNGYAKVHTVKPNTEYRKLFKRLEGFAKRSMLGLWDTGGLGTPSEP